MSARDLLWQFAEFARRKKLRDVLLGFEGRINREQYWLAWLCWFVATVIAVVVLLLIGWMLAGVLAAVLAFVLAIIAVNSWIAVGIKRLHDRGKSGWWLLLFYLVPSAQWVIKTFAYPAWFILDVAGLAIFIWMIVELGCLPGVPGPNKYGPEPQAAAPEPLIGT